MHKDVYNKGRFFLMHHRVSFGTSDTWKFALIRLERGECLIRLYLFSPNIKSLKIMCNLDVTIVIWFDIEI